MQDDVRPDVWAAELEEVLLRVGHRFGRVDLRRRMRDYVRGLLGPVGRKNGWQLAEYVGHDMPAGLQHLLNRARWDADEVRDDLQEYVAERLGEPEGVLIIDETGFLKKGTASAGVQRQYSGTAGRTENCQVAVFAAYASSRGRTLVDRELYLPKSWTSDRERCRMAGVPGERAFATKTELARDLVARALASPLPIAWVTADALYGQDWNFRRMLEESGLGYVVAAPKSQQVKSLAGCWRIDQLISDAPDNAWERLSCGDGAKGPRVFDRAAAMLPAVPFFDGGEPSHRRWVLARRSIARPDEIAYYLAYAATGTTVSQRPAGHDAGPGQGAVLDAVPHGDAVVEEVAQAALGGDPVPQGPFPSGGVVVGGGPAAERRRAPKAQSSQVHMGVDQPRKDRLARQVDHRRVGRDRCAGPGGDPAAGDDDGRAVDHGPRPGRPWALTLEDRVLLVAMYCRTNLTMRQLAPLFGISAAAVGRIISRHGPLLALGPGKRKPGRHQILIVDGTLVPTRDRTVSASSKNYRYSANLQVLIKAETRLVLAVGRPLPGNHNDCTAFAESRDARPTRLAPTPALGADRRLDVHRLRR